MTETITYIPAGPTIEAFHKSEAFVRALMGPVGSSKSSACFWELVDRGMRQKPVNGRRRSRWLVIRQTYPELKSTTIDTCQRWMPQLNMSWDAPITGELRLPLPDGTVSEQEFVFLAIERPDDVKKLKSFEATGAWINEASEVHREVFEMALQRIGRYPAVREGGFSWCGLILDTNPPDTDSWWYETFEKDRPASYEIFHQPGALMEVGDQFIPNPKAENVSSYVSDQRPTGYEYWINQVPKKSKEWVRVFCCGRYGVVTSGKPVYSEYSDELHCREAQVNDMLPLVLGWDFGMTAACVITQLTKRGQLVVLDELVAENMGIRQFAADIVKPYLALNFPNHCRRKAEGAVVDSARIMSVGDPAGLHRTYNEARTCFMELADVGFTAMPALTNDVLARIEAVRKFLTKLIDGQPGFILHPKATQLRKGFLGKYCFERVQVTGPERYKDAPTKNQYSHPHDALQYAAMHLGHVELTSWKSGGKKLFVPMAIA